MCTAVVKEVLAYYTQQANSNVFCTFLDASKAIDKVHYCKLFSRLIERNVPPLVIRVLLNMYSGQHVRVLWNGIFSCDFLVKNGVKQGGIISPILFCIYFDDVLCRLLYRSFVRRCISIRWRYCTPCTVRCCHACYAIYLRWFREWVSYVVQCQQI